MAFSLDGSVILKGTSIRVCLDEQSSKGACIGEFLIPPISEMYYQSRSGIMNKLYSSPGQTEPQVNAS